MFGSLQIMKNRKKLRYPKAELATAIPLDERLLTVRGQKVILDADLAEVSGGATKALNQAIKRNAERFPSDFSFLLNAQEKTEVVTICDHLSRLRFSPVLPRAFTEHGAIMAANVSTVPRQPK
jgi:hypothetical protein